jgi:hypothetical protein
MWVIGQTKGIYADTKGIVILHHAKTKEWRIADVDRLHVVYGIYESYDAALKVVHDFIAGNRHTNGVEAFVFPLDNGKVPLQLQEIKHIKEVTNE